MGSQSERKYTSRNSLVRTLLLTLSYLDYTQLYNEVSKDVAGDKKC